MGKKRERRTKDEHAALIQRVCDLFFNKKLSAADIAGELKEEQVNISREQIYPLLARGRDLGIIQLLPTFDEFMPAQIADHFDNKFSADSVTVAANVGGTWANDYVSAAAAKLVLNLAMDLNKEEVGLGLGPGRATLEFSREFARLLLSTGKTPMFRLHAITGGAPVKRPHLAPVSFFNLFPEHCIKESIGLFSEPLVTVAEFNKMRDSKNRPGISEAFQERDKIDIVVTSMGDFRHEHDLFNLFLPEKERKQLEADQAVGNVQFRPFNARGPCAEKPTDNRVVTLFELQDFADRSMKKGQHVVLIARSCPVCGATRTNALRPLMEVKSLKVWSELVIDAATGRKLINDPRPVL